MAVQKAVAPKVETTQCWEINLFEDETTGRQVAMCPEPGCAVVRIRNTKQATAEAIAEHLLGDHQRGH